MPVFDPRTSLRDALAAKKTRQPVVLLDAMPLSGTTRTMYEMLRRRRPRAHVIDLDIRDLLDLAASGALTEKSPFDQFVVWLDDLCPGDLVLLAAGALDLLASHATILANTNTRWCERFSSDTARFTEPARRLVSGQGAKRATVPFAMEPEARATLQARHPNVALGASIGETFTGGDVALRHYRAGATAHPDGYALAAAAADLRRAGVHQVLDESELRELWRTVADGGRRRSTFAEALRWATTAPEGASFGPLIEQERKEDPRGNDHRVGPCWTSARYLAGADDGDHGAVPRAIPDAFWKAALDLRPADAFRIGVAAHLRGRADVARDAFDRAVGDPHPAIAHAAVAARDSSTCDREAGYEPQPPPTSPVSPAVPPRSRPGVLSRRT